SPACGSSYRVEPASAGATRRPLVSAHEPRLGEDVTLHRVLEVRLRRRREAREDLVERVELEEVAVPPARWRRSDVLGRLRVALARARAGRQPVRAHAFGEPARARRDVVEDPVDETATRRIRVV